MSEDKMKLPMVFYDKHLGKCQLRVWGSEKWIFQHNRATDNWMSIRKATDDDIQKLEELYRTGKRIPVHGTECFDCGAEIIDGKHDCEWKE